MADDLAMTAEKAVGNGRMKELYVVTKTLSQEKQNCECSLKMRLEIYKQKKQPRKKGKREYFEEILYRSIPNDPRTEDPVIEEISTSHISKQKLEQQ